MFRVSFFVDDKHLAPVMHGLAGVTRNLEVTPVVNAAVTGNGTLTQKAGSTSELIMQEIKKRKLKQITSKELREIVKGNGLSPTSWNHFSQQLCKAGALKKFSKGVYEVVRA